MTNRPLSSLNHINLDNSLESTNFSCHTCCKSFKNASGLHVHIGKMHRLMPECNQPSQTTSTDETGVLNSSFDIEEPFLTPAFENQINSPIKTDIRVKCQLCKNSNSYKNETGLKIHMSRCHKADLSKTEVDPNSGFQERICKLKSNAAILKRIPRGARVSVAQKLTSVIKSCISFNTFEAWEDLLLFSYRVFHISPKSANKDKSLTCKVKENTVTYKTPHLILSTTAKHKPNYKIAESKLNDGDVRGAIRVLTSNDKIANEDSNTLEHLKCKHPTPSRSLHHPAPPTSQDPVLTVTKKDVYNTIMSFPNGSAAGIDGLRPQHLKDLIGYSVGETGQQLLSQITNLCNFMLSGKVNVNVTPFLYGGSLCALTKKDGGIRPIAVGCTFRRLVSKLGCRLLSTLLSDYLKPYQVGVGVKSGCEAAVHAVRTYIAKNNSAEILLKIDVKNAFNSVERDILLQNVKEIIPQLYPYLWQCYSSPSNLMYKQHLIQSSVGCQQGDPLGPAIFSLAIHPIIKKLASKLNIWYLDDGILGGSYEEVLGDLKTIIDEFKNIGLSLNFSKCELYFCKNITNEQTTMVLQEFEYLTPTIQVSSTNNLFLLGAPLTEEAFPSLATKIMEKFTSLANNLSNINPHMAFFLLRNCLWIPKLNYFLRCCPFWKHNDICQLFDTKIKNILEELLNISLSPISWNHASLPVSLGGLGIRSISDLSLPSFLASIHCTSDLVGTILNPSLTDFEIQYKLEALDFWVTQHPDLIFPDKPVFQRNWDLQLMTDKHHQLLSHLGSPHRGILLAASEQESGAWLDALPSANLGTLLDKHVLQIAISLRIGSDLPTSYVCL